MISKRNRIGILGGSFDPAHKGHLTISKEAVKKFKLKKVIGKANYIQVKFYEDKIKSNKTFKLIDYLSKNSNHEIYFIMGADNLINFHKWHNWKKISKKCKIIVFDRHGYKKKSLNSLSFKRLNGNNLRFIEFNKVNISSSQLRKI